MSDTEEVGLQLKNVKRVWGPWGYNPEVQTTYTKDSISVESEKLQERRKEAAELFGGVGSTSYKNRDKRLKKLVVEPSKDVTEDLFHFLGIGEISSTPHIQPDIAGEPLDRSL